LSAIMARKKSEDSIAVGRKCFCAKVDFPEPEGPTRSTRLGSGKQSLAMEGEASAFGTSGRGTGRRWGTLAVAACCILPHGGCERRPAQSSQGYQTTRHAACSRAAAEGR